MHRRFTRLPLVRLWDGTNALIEPHDYEVLKPCIAVRFPPPEEDTAGGLSHHYGHLLVTRSLPDFCSFLSLFPHRHRPAKCSGRHVHFAACLLRNWQQLARHAFRCLTKVGSSLVLAAQEFASLIQANIRPGPIILIKYPVFTMQTTVRPAALPQRSQDPKPFGKDVLLRMTALERASQVRWTPRADQALIQFVYEDDLIRPSSFVQFTTKPVLTAESSSNGFVLDQAPPRLPLQAWLVLRCPPRPLIM